MKLTTHRLAVVFAAFLAASGAVPARAQAPPMPDADLSLGYQSLHIPGQNYPLGVCRCVERPHRHGGTSASRLSIDRQSASNAMVR